MGSCRPIAYSVPTPDNSPSGGQVQSGGHLVPGVHLAPVVVTEEWPKGSGRLGGANVTEGYEEAFAEVRKTPAGRRLAEFADAPRRREKAG